MILIVETQKIYNAVFLTQEQREAHTLIKGALCDEETRKELRNFLKNTDSDTLLGLSSLDFCSWNELAEAMKDMSSFPGSFFIKELKK